MADWFVYQKDLYPHEFDPDAFGVMLVPVYDSAHSIIYRDAPTSNNNGLRRVESKWGVDTDIVQYDVLLHGQQPLRDGLPPLHSPSTIMQTIQWTPSQHSFAFYNTTNGFNFENTSLNQCMFVERDSNQNTRGKIMQKDTNGQYTIYLGHITAIRIHKLTLLTPPSLKTTWFSKYVTTHTTPHTNRFQTMPHSHSNLNAYS